MGEDIGLSGYQGDEIDPAQKKEMYEISFCHITVAGVIYGNGEMTGCTGKAGYDRIRTG